MAIAIPKDYSEVTYRQAERLVQTNIPDGFEKNYMFYEGDHWQDGDGWPQAIDSSADGAKYMQKLIETLFESKNVIGEVTERYLDGLLENQPEAHFSPPDPEDPSDENEQRADSVDQEVSRWMRMREFHDEAREALLYAVLGGRGYLRPYIPPALRNDDGEIGGQWTEIYNTLHVVAVKPTRAVIYTHPDTGRDLSVFHWTPGETHDVEDPRRSDDREQVELGWIDPDTGETVVRILKEGEAPEEMQQTQDADLAEETEQDALDQRQFRIDLDENLLLQEIEVQQLITEQVRSSQKSLNLSKTMLSHNEVSAGFQERMFLNAQPPGTRKEDQDGNVVFEPNPLKRGPLRSHFIQGSKEVDEMGNEVLKDPEVVFNEPSSPDTFIRGKQSKRKDILDEVSQTFVLSTSETDISGRARLIARHEFTKTLNKAQSGVMSLYRGTLMSVTIMATEFGTGGPMVQDLRLPVEVYPDSGPLTPEEMKALESMTEAGLMSMQTALSRAGINDIEAEQERIQEEEGSRIQRLIERAKLMKELVAAGASLPGAAQVAGFSEEEAEQLQTGFDGTAAEAVQEMANGAPR